MSALAIIPSFLRQPSDLEVLLKTIETVRWSEPHVDILVVDDCSPVSALVEGLESYAEEFDFEIEENERNVGFSRTVNVGLRAALLTGVDAILINADIECMVKGWLDICINQKDMQDRPASVVGALLIYPLGLIQHGGIFFCSPGDECVLTAQDGYVPLADLDAEDHGLVGYARKENRIFRCEARAGRRMPGSGRSAGGYGFEIGHRPYAGDLIVIDAGDKRTRVTPNHRLTVHWTERALSSHAVYLMRRGRDWRIGHTKMAHGGTAGERGWALGPRLRLDQQKADELWILSLHQSKQDALQQENLLAWSYGVPTLQFKCGPGGLEQRRLDFVWSELDLRAAALALLRDFRRDLHCPLLVSRAVDGRRRAPVGPQRRYEIAAANLMTGMMRVPTDPGSGQQPDPQVVHIEREKYSGLVYSLNVPPHEHYVSGGVVVHNSMLNRSFDHRYRFGPVELPEAHQAALCPVTGAFQYIRHECLQSVGLYDEDFRMGYEDVDYCLRVFESGRECIYQPRVQALHHESLFRGRADAKLTDWQTESLQILMKKHQNTNMARWVPAIL